MRINKLMKKLYIILFSLFYGPVSCTQPITYYWVEAGNKTKIWISDKDFNPQTVSLHWDGPTFENLAHGTGTLRIDIANSQIVQPLHAFYGAADEKGIAQDLKNGNRYIGPKQDGKPQGFGVLVKPNEDLDIGHFHEGHINGNVTFIRQGKPYYRGQYENGAFNGIGIRYDKDGEKNCIWKDGVAQACVGTKQVGKDKYTGYYTPNGCEERGKMEYANGDVYEGEWKANERNGQGRMDFADGRIYEGEWKDNFAHGEGTYETDSFIYTGMWEKSAAHGLGLVEYIDGAKYNGSWKNGKKDGYGDFLFPNGDAYFGDWEDDQKQGNGRYLFADGSYYMGEIADDNLNGTGEFDTTNFHYIGDVEDGQPSGQGTVNFANGDVYIGNLLNGKKEGLGHYTFAESGNYYEGTFVNDKFDGLGIFHFKGVGEYQGVFADGKPFGEGQFAFTEGGENVQVLIKGMWDGFKLPEDVTVKFANGDIYTGKLVNGALSRTGTWSHEEKGIFKKLSQNAALAYREHQETIDKAMPYIVGSLLAVSVIATAVASGGTATVPAVAAAGKIAAATYGTMLVTEATYCVAQTNSNIQLDGLNAETTTKALACAGEFAVDAATPPALGKVVSKAGKAVVVAGGAVAAKTAGKKVVKKGAQKTLQKSVKELAQTTGKVLIEQVEKVWPKGANYITHTYERMTINGIQKHFSKEIDKILKNPKTVAKLKSIQEKFSQPSEALKKGWEALFGPIPKKAAAHHICPAKLAPKRLTITGCKAILESCLIDINSPLNAAILPTSKESILLGTIHNGRHTNAYFEKVSQRLNTAYKQKNGCQKVRKELDVIRKSLVEGTGDFKLYKSKAANQANTIFGTHAI